MLLRLSPSLPPIQPVSRVLYSENSSCFNIIYEQIVQPWKLGTLDAYQYEALLVVPTYVQCPSTIISAVGWQHRAH